LLLLALAGSIRFIERKKARRQIEHLERQQLVEKERARIARDIHDELGASLTEIGLLSEFARREAGPPEQVKADLEKIAGKAQSSTRALDQIVWAVNPRNDTVESFVTYACASAQEQLGLADIRCRLDVASLLPRQPLRADLRHHLFMAFKEALNNILKHARASQVDIRFRADAGQLSVLISDNGCGFVYAGPGTASLTSTGLTGMKERLASVGAEIECDTAPARGTRIKLTMKLT
jgi:signal transduction histidine kinase